LEIEREIGRIDESAYQTALGMIQEGLRRINDERNDLESLKSQLSNLILGDAPSVQKELGKAPDSPPPLPEPPVVVHVKGTSKSGN